jgi:hypothetical protein
MLRGGEAGLFAACSLLLEVNPCAACRWLGSLYLSCLLAPVASIARPQVAGASNVLGFTLPFHEAATALRVQPCRREPPDMERGYQCVAHALQEDNYSMGAGRGGSEVIMPQC